MKEITIVNGFTLFAWGRAIYIDGKLFKYIENEYECDAFDSNSTAMEIIKMLASASNTKITIKNLIHAFPANTPIPTTVEQYGDLIEDSNI